MRRWIGVNEGVVLSKAIDSHESNLAPLRALRQVHHDRLKRELFEKDKDARLRSGTRGMAARKALLASRRLLRSLLNGEFVCLMFWI